MTVAANRVASLLFAIVPSLTLIAGIGTPAGIITRGRRVPIGARPDPCTPDGGVSR